MGRRHVMSAHWIGHGAGELLPAQLGQAVRYAAIRRHPAASGGCGLRVAGSLGAVKVIDGLVTFVVAAVATVVIPLPDAASFLRWVALGALVGLAGALLVVRRLHPAQVARFLPRRAQGPMLRFCEGAAMLGRGRETLVAMGLQLGAVAGRVVSLALLLHAFGMPAAAALLVFALLVMSGLIAISPGGVGVREAALVPALVATYGMGANTVVAFSLGVQATALGVSLVGAALALLTARLLAAQPGRGGPHRLSGGGERAQSASLGSVSPLTRKRTRWPSSAALLAIRSMWRATSTAAAAQARMPDSLGAWLTAWSTRSSIGLTRRASRTAPSPASTSSREMASTARESASTAHRLIAPMRSRTVSSPSEGGGTEPASLAMSTARLPTRSSATAAMSPTCSSRRSPAKAGQVRCSSRMRLLERGAPHVRPRGRWRSPTRRRSGPPRPTP